MLMCHRKKLDGELFKTSQASEHILMDEAFPTRVASTGLNTGPSQEEPLGRAAAGGLGRFPPSKRCS